MRLRPPRSGLSRSDFVPWRFSDIPRYPLFRRFRRHCGHNRGLTTLLDELRDQPRAPGRENAEYSDRFLDRGLGVRGLDPAEVLALGAHQRDPPLADATRRLGRLARHDSEYKTPTRVVDNPVGTTPDTSKFYFRNLGTRHTSVSSRMGNFGRGRYGKLRRTASEGDVP